MLGPNQQKWVDALRSGKYKQTEGTLENSYGYCCLGVACKVAEEENIYVERNDSGNIAGGTLLSQPYIQEWIGLKTIEGKINSLDKSLTELNDDEDDGKTFAELADIIEEYALELFREVK